MGNKRRTPGDRRPSSMRERVRALEASLDSVLGPEQTRENPECTSASGLPALTDAEKAFVAQFGQVEVVKKLLGDQAEPNTRTRRNRPG